MQSRLLRRVLACARLPSLPPPLCRPPVRQIGPGHIGPPVRALSTTLGRRDKQDEYGRELNDAEYEEISEETLESLAEALEGFNDCIPVRDEFDVTYSQGVLTMLVDSDFGTYVVNKQTPNKQIWLSSPISGPKRYDYVHGRWLYGREDETLHALLACELRAHFPLHAEKIDFSDCAYSGAD